MDIGKDICGRYPGVHYWEHDDPRLLVCEAYLLPNRLIEKTKNEKASTTGTRTLSKGFYLPQNYDASRSLANADDKAKAAAAELAASACECLVISMFFNLEKGLLVYDSYPRGEIYSKLISVKIPSHFFVTKVNACRDNISTQFDLIFHTTGKVD